MYFAFLIAVVNLALILSFSSEVQSTGPLSEECGLAFPTAVTHRPDSYLEVGTQLLFRTVPFCGSGELESVDLFGSCTEGYDDDNDDDDRSTEYSIQVQILSWSFRRYYVRRQATLSVTHSCSKEHLHFDLETPLAFYKGYILGLFIPPSDAIRLGLVKAASNEKLAPYENLASFQETRSNSSNFAVNVYQEYVRNGDFPLFSAQVSGCNCSRFGSSLNVVPPATTNVVPPMPSTAAMVATSSNTVESETSSAAPSSSVEVYPGPMPGGGFEQPLPALDGTMTAMMVGLALLGVFLLGLLVTAIVLSLVCGIFRRKSRRKEMIKVAATKSAHNPGTITESIYDEIYHSSIPVPNPYEVPRLSMAKTASPKSTEPDDFADYDVISLKPSLPVFSDRSLKMNNSGLYDSLLVVQRSCSMTPSDVISISETDASTAMESPLWKSFPSNMLGVQPESYYYKLEPSSPNPNKSHPLISGIRSPKEPHLKPQAKHDYWTVEACPVGCGTPKSEKELYWSPGQDEAEIYSHLTAQKCKEISWSSLTLIDKIGEGNFGEVHRASMHTESGGVKVAVKMMKKGSSGSEKIKLLQEAAILRQFSHPHIVSLYGVVTDKDPIMVVMELLQNGDLSNYLQTIPKKECDQDHSEQLQGLLLGYSRQIAEGLAYLADKSFVHRDIAARNILLDDELKCKISDFGLTKDLCDDDYYVVSKGGAIPIKWTAPEAIFYKKYSPASDVWSFGMTMYEIWSLGRKPFADKTVEEVVELLNTGYCQPPPVACPRPVYEIMVKCWNPNYNERPSAQILFSKLEDVTDNLASCQADYLLDSGVDAGVPTDWSDLQTMYTKKSLL